VPSRHAAHAVVASMSLMGRFRPAAACTHETRFKTTFVIYRFARRRGRAFGMAAQSEMHFAGARVKPPYSPVLPSLRCVRCGVEFCYARVHSQRQPRRSYATRKRARRRVFQRSMVVCSGKFCAASALSPARLPEIEFERRGRPERTPMNHDMVRTTTQAARRNAACVPCNP